MLETWAAGLPVASSDLGGILELLSQRRGGFLVPMHSEGWRQLLLYLLGQPSLLANQEVPDRQFHHLALEMAQLYRSLHRSSGQCRSGQ